MHSTVAYERRETLSTNELERLRATLIDEVGRYREAIRGYSPKKMANHGQPFLAKLENRVTEVEQLIASRAP